MRTTKGHPLGMLVVCAAVIVCLGTASADWVTATVPTGNAPSAVAVNPVTNRVYVANSSSKDVTVIDGSTNGTTTVPVGSDPGAVAVNPVKRA